ncbi:MAG: peptidoglycan DD-metalloendopeptidase family protein [Deltaproteobacteria bacterium]|nr:peptidoglycan DD-metalloendopeptidase family protein [Deltaproteobacteria bacterium]
MKFKSLLLGVCVLFCFHGCTYVYTAHGAYYRVKKGDTLDSVAKKFKVELQVLAENNDIRNATDVKPGDHLYIPGATPDTFSKIIQKERVVHKWVPKRRSNPKPTPSEPTIEVQHDHFSWPIEGELSSGFGMRHGRRHDGIDIRAKRGSPVKASSDGIVVFSKRMRGYGNLVLIQHEDDFFTVYAHNSVNLVKKGAKIKKGQLIAKVGSTGRATGPHVHFEVRKGTTPRNPLFFLPDNRYVQTTKKGDEDYGGPEEENP